MKLDFEDRVVIVTGGGQGIGRVVARSFSAAGACVVIAELDDEAGRENEQYIKDNGGKCLFIKTDVASSQHPAGRVGRPEDVAKACLYLASEDASFITGTNLIIDGGMTVKMIYN